MNIMIFDVFFSDAPLFLKITMAICFVVATITLLIGFYLLLIYGILPILFYYKGKKAINSEGFANQSENHTAIIIPEYPERVFWKNFFGIISGVDILTSGLRQLREPYIIYRPSSAQAFREIIKTVPTKKIWIFGHGFRYGVGVGEEKMGFNDFVNLKNSFGKEYIIQLQCYGSKELIDNLCLDPSKSFYTDKLRTFYENRKFISQRFKKMKTEKF
jgi:hypothetical protein